MDRNRLLTTLTDCFDLDEIKTLIARLGIAPDAIAGETRESRARELVLWAERNSCTDALAEAILEMKGENPQVRASLFSEEDAGADQPAPYVGLRTFTEEQAKYFFGRGALVAELTQRVGAAPFLAVLGPSGSGKSSAVLAGLLPTLKNGALTFHCFSQALAMIRGSQKSLVGRVGGRSSLSSLFPLFPSARLTRNALDDVS